MALKRFAVLFEYLIGFVTMKRDFFRKVGFGLGLDEAVPDDPLAWAQAQMDAVPPLSWKGDIPSGDSLMDHYAHWVYTDRKVLAEKA